MHKVFLTIVVLSGVLSGCTSFYYSNGVRAYERKNFEEAVYYLELAAEDGHYAAQEMLGYKNGVKPDTSRISFKKRLAIKSAYEEDQ